MFNRRYRHVKKPILPIILVCALSFILMSWGYEGHYRINTNAALSFNAEMSQFLDWTSTLAEHASDADNRKSQDETEAPKHYIDIDSYPEFVADGHIATEWDSVVAQHGESFVMENGILPWATLATYDTLRSCFERRDWDKAVLVAADLGHYVADGHMPLHICKNYNGQLTGNTGIHSRYESTMINAHIQEINYSGSPVAIVHDVKSYIFSYLYDSYKYADSVLIADDYAKEIAGDTKSSNYVNALWDRTGGFTIKLFSEASHSLAELIYSAWVEAGSPKMNTESSFFPLAAPKLKLEQNRPNPFTSYTTINYSLPGNSTITLEVKDLRGSTVATIENGYKREGQYQINWSPDNQPAGIYYLVLNTGNACQVKKMVKIE